MDFEQKETLSSRPLWNLGKYAGHLIKMYFLNLLPKNWHKVGQGQHHQQQLQLSTAEDDTLKTNWGGRGPRHQNSWQLCATSLFALFFGLIMKIWPFAIW